MNQLVNANPFESESNFGLPNGPTDNGYTNEHYRKQFARLEHHNKFLHAELVDTLHHLKMLRKEVHEVMVQRKQDAAEIGRLNGVVEELQGKLATVEQAWTKSREAYEELRKERREKVSQGK